MKFGTKPASVFLRKTHDILSFRSVHILNSRFWLFRCSIRSCVYPCKFQLTMVTSSMIARWNKEDEVIFLPATPRHTLTGSMYRESMPLVLLMLASIFTNRLHKLVLAPTCHDVFETKISQPHSNPKPALGQGFCWTHQLKVIASTWPPYRSTTTPTTATEIGTWLRSCVSCILWPAISSWFFHNLKGGNVQT